MASVADRIQIVRDDITRLQVDAIVNAASNELLGGGGVDGAIHRAAGPQLLEECRSLHGCATGEAKITSGYALPARWVIHTVGPVWRGGNHQEDELLARAYRSCLQLARERQISSIAFPAISAGVYGFPLERATRIALTEIKQFLQQDTTLERVLMVCFSDRAYQCYTDTLAEVLAES